MTLNYRDIFNVGCIIKGLFFLAIVVLPCDGWPFGIKILREFGARPTNFILLTSAFLITLITFLKGRIPVPFGKCTILLLVIFLFFAFINGAMVANSPIETHFLGREAIVSWLFQFMMLLWMIVSWAIWHYGLYHFHLLDREYPKFVTFVLISAVLATILFLFDAIHVFFDIWVVPGFDMLLTFLRGSPDKWRPSGMCTEPSLWGAWVAFAWPLLVFSGGPRVCNRDRLLFKVSKLIGFSLIVLAIVSGARTFLVIFVFQLFLLFIASKQVRSRSVNRLFFYFSILVIMIIVFVVGAPRFVSLGQLDQNLSSMARIGSTITSVKTFIDNPLVGVGLGQFSAVYERYAPMFSFYSEEVRQWAAGESIHRASTFNLFTRFAAEMGFPGLVISVAVGILMLKWAISVNRVPIWDGDRALGFLLSFFGGASFWLSQDQFGYQVGLLSVAIVTAQKRMSEKGSC